MPNKGIPNLMRYLLCILLLLWQPSVGAATGIYAGIATGFARQSGLPKEVNGLISREKNNFPIVRAHIAYLHDFNANFGIGFEVGKGYYGRTNYDLNTGEQIEFKTTATDYLLVAAYHFKCIDVMGKIGGNRNTVNIKRSLGNNKKECRIQLVLMAELVYHYNSHLAFTLGYLHAFGNTITDITAASWQAPGINSGLLGLRITFW